MRFILRILVLLAVSVGAAIAFNNYTRARVIPRVADVGKLLSDSRERPLPWTPPESDVVADPEKAAENEIGVEEVVRLYNQSIDQPGTVFFVDARPHEQYLEGHIPGALNAPAAEIMQHAELLINNIPPDALVVIYCGGGDCRDSKAAFREMKGAFGYTNLKIYTAGWEEWHKQQSQAIEVGESPYYGPVEHPVAEDSEQLISEVP